MSWSSGIKFWRPGTANAGGERGGGGGERGDGRGGGRRGRGEGGGGRSSLSGLVGEGEEGEEGSAYAAAALSNPRRGLPVARQRLLLPVARRRGAIVRAVEEHQGVVVVGATGSGKTTQIPQYLLEAGWCEGDRVVMVTEPRQIAAVGAAERVALEQGCSVGEEVGYSMRLDHRMKASTKIVFLTHGTLIRTMMSDPLLSRVSVVMVDEAHERSVECDLLLGLLKKVRRRRGDLRIMVASATIRADEFVQFLGAKSTQVVNVEGKCYSVQNAYLKQPTKDYVHEALETVMDLHHRTKLDSGSILVFLPSAEECEELTQRISDRLRSQSTAAVCVPLYASLPADAQLQAIEAAPPGKRKIIVATNVAETSVTIDGIAFVIDALFVKMNSFSVIENASSLSLVPVSRASADQRAGRAGRTRPGQCFRLCTYRDFQRLAPTAPAEIHRADLTALVLQLKAFGIHDLMSFHFMSSPSSDVVVEALERLFDLGAVDRDGHLTPEIGLRMAEMPLAPLLARCLLAAEDLQCGQEMCAVLGMLQSSTLLISASPQFQRKQYEAIRAPYAVAEGDLLTYLNMYNSYLAHGGGGSGEVASSWCARKRLNSRGFRQARRIAKSLANYVKQDTGSHSGGDDRPRPKDRLETRLRKAICSGLFLNAVVVTPNGSYISPLSRSAGCAEHTTMRPHPTSVLFDRYPRWLVFVESIVTQEQYMRHLTVIDPHWLTEVAPSRFENQRKRALEQFRGRFDEQTSSKSAKFT